MVLSTYIWVGLFGSLGALARFQISTWLNHPEGFPMGTLLVNVIGCLLLGFCTSLSETYLDGAIKKGVVTGFLGSLTTFSTFSMETIQLFEHNPNQGFLYFFSQLLLGFLAAWLGFWIGKFL